MSRAPILSASSAPATAQHATTRPSTAILAILRFLLKFSRVFNFVACLMIALAIPASLFFEAEFVAFFTKRPPSIDPAWLMPVLRLWLVLAIPLAASVHVLLTRALEMVATVSSGDPFVPANAARLKTIAWCLLIIQLLGLSFGVMAGLMNAAGSSIDWEFSLTGWISVLLVFVLARVFEEGARMREEVNEMI